MPHPGYPIFDPALRIGVLTPGLSLRRLLRRVRKCRAIAASVPLLRSLAADVESGSLVLPPVEAAVIAFTGIRHGELTELERDLFWRVFQVPVFEQLLAPDGRLIATECDAHDGLHLLDPDAPLTGWRALVDVTPCACGSRQPRLVRCERLRVPSGAAPSDAPSVISAAVPAHIDDDRDDQYEQVGPARRVS
jgi:hypothetical protein